MRLSAQFAVPDLPAPNPSRQQERAFAPQGIRINDNSTSHRYNCIYPTAMSPATTRALQPRC